jgi:hypothetical protein
MLDNIYEYDLPDVFIDLIEARKKEMPSERSNA